MPTFNDDEYNVYETAGDRLETDAPLKAHVLANS